MAGQSCQSTFRITDTAISGDRFTTRRLSASERVGLLRAMARLSHGYFVAHPFNGTCPVAYDGQESVYRFRGFARVLPGCRYDLSGVEAIRVVDRLIATLKPAAR